MATLLERLAVRLGNRVLHPRSRIASSSGDLSLGHAVIDGALQREHVFVPGSRRPEHIAVLGKTGSGKSSLLRHFAAQDLRADRGFLFFDLHGDTTPALLKLIAREEQVRGCDLAGRTVLIDPSDAWWAVGLDVLSSPGNARRLYVEVAESIAVLKHHWGLEALGARTEELLRNALLVLLDRKLTLLELGPFLSDAEFRMRELAACRVPEAVEYFRSRYDGLSDMQQWVYRDAVLNKVSAFTSDPHFRHLLGQHPPTVSLRDAVERGLWVIVSLPKGRLGAEAHTLGALILARLKGALFGRQNRQLFSIYADELQQLLSYDAGLEELFSEARKFGVSVVSANQYLDQYPPAMRKAVLATGTQVYFQLSGPDARTIGTLLGGGVGTVERLASLPKQELLVQTHGAPVQHVRAPDTQIPDVSALDLVARIRRRWMRRRSEVEASIQARQSRGTVRTSLAGWD